MLSNTVIVTLPPIDANVLPPGDDDLVFAVSSVIVTLPLAGLGVIAKQPEPV